MSDPYSILGVDRNATDEDVKKDEAEAKFKEVQQAYQQIMDEREKGYTSGYGSSDGSGYGGYDPFGGFGGFGSYGYGSAGSTGRTSGMSEEDAHLNAAANYIRSGHYKEALNVLDGISQHSARWYFYSASANSGLGNNVTALEHAREAVRLEPQNMQYQMLLQQLEGGGNWYQTRQTMYGYPGTYNSSWCVKLCRRTENVNTVFENRTAFRQGSNEQAGRCPRCSVRYRWCRWIRV